MALEFSAFVVNGLGILAAVVVPFMAGKGPVPAEDATVVEIVLGQNSTLMEGDAPYISLFNNHGERTARWSDKFKNVPAGGNYKATIRHGNEIDDTRWWPPRYAQTASYILLSGEQNNGICISAVTVTEASFKALFMGDMAQACGAPWGYGDTPIGGGSGPTFMPKCFWIDGDATEGSPRSVSIHLPDFIATKTKFDQYNRDKTTMCNSTPRFAWWSKLQPHSWIPTFQPPLEYNPDKYVGPGGKEEGTGEPTGSDKDLSRIVDNPGTYDRNAERYMPPGLPDPYIDSYEKTEEEKGWSSSSGYASGKRDLKPRQGRLRRRDPLTDHLVVSQHAEHSARLLCESPTSRMQDFVSLTEGLFCDMDTKTLYPLCDDGAEKKGVVTDCFRLKTHTLVLADGTESVQNVGTLARRAEPKVYKSAKYWS